MVNKINERVLIVGGGQAGARTALALRDHGWQGDILIAGDETEYPYERPPLSKSVLMGQEDPADATVLSNADCISNGIELMRGEAVAALDLDRNRVRMSSGAQLGFSHLVIATGSRARKMSLPEAQLDGVFTLRTARDAMAVRSRLQPGVRVAIVGGGFIGLEVAASACEMGCSVTVIEVHHHLLGRVVTPTIAAVVERLHLAKGIDVRTNARIEAIEGLDSVRRLRLADGSAIEADMVIVGVGALANDGLAIAAGMPCCDGILVDEGARTSADGVFAVGDVARHVSLWGARGVRLESWENAELQSAAAARSIMGHSSVPGAAPWFWTDQFGGNLQMLGYPNPLHEVVVRGSLDDDSWCVFMLDCERIAAAYLWNAGRERSGVARFMNAGAPVSAEQLADRERPLRNLLKVPS